MKTKRPRRLRERQIGLTELSAVRLLDWGGANLVERIVDHLKRLYPHVDVEKGHWARQRLLIAGDSNRSPHVIIHPWGTGQMFRAVICTKEEADLMVANATMPHGAIAGVTPIHPISLVRRLPEWTKKAPAPEPAA